MALLMVACSSASSDGGGSTSSSPLGVTTATTATGRTATTTTSTGSAPTATTTRLLAEPTVELLGWEATTPPLWWPALRSLSIYGSPGVTGFAPLPPELELPEGVERLDIGLGWGIDSGANLVLLSGEGADSPNTVAQLDAVTEYVGSGESWSAAAFPSGLSAPFEMGRLIEWVEGLAVPETACESGLCPLGAEYGFPSPPASLVTNQAFTPGTALPFTVEVVSADGSLEAAHLHWGPTHLEDGMVMGPGLEDLDPVVTETFTAHFGVLVYIDEEAQRVETLRRWEPGAEGAGWSIPEDWVIDGLAVVMTGRDTGELVASGLIGGVRQVRSIELHMDGFYGQDVYRGSADLAESELISPVGSDWSLPGSTFFSALHVVDRRSDGWYLVRVSAEGPVDLIRTDGPIVDYDLDPTHRHLALAVVGSEGATNWWVYQEQVVRLPGSATALGWSGAHWLEWDD
ncbi:MAG: hypothetical protein GY713_03080 [Actinomycetia bacterium]|nr:hypothetical protein [Actinomycetes bacterium]